MDNMMAVELAGYAGAIIALHIGMAAAILTLPVTAKDVAVAKLLGGIK